MNKIIQTNAGFSVKNVTPNPYDLAPPHSSWRKCLSVSDFYLREMYQPSVTLSGEDRIATAGSCFAQKIGYELRNSTANVIDYEPIPHGMSRKTATRLGFGLYSARYGNIYTSAQWLQLIQDAFSENIRSDALWKKNDRYFDGLRANLEPSGYVSLDICMQARLAHLYQIRRLCLDATVFIFTLGLTERWENRETGTVYPICPGAIDAHFGSTFHFFNNVGLSETVRELEQCITLLRAQNPFLRFIFTVSPVPLMATASGGHVLAATSRSKAILRTAIEEVVRTNSGCDYFPSYEIVTFNPLHRIAFEANQREVRGEVVESIMEVFFQGHPLIQRSIQTKDEEIFFNCDETLLGASTS